MEQSSHVEGAIFHVTMNIIQHLKLYSIEFGFKNREKVFPEENCDEII